MEKNKIILFVALFLAMPLSAENFERILTEEECVRLASNVNHDILIHKQSVLFAEQRKKEAKALYFPTIDLNLNGSKFSNDVPTIINSNSLPASIYLPAANRDYFYSARVSLWQNIYNGGKTVATNKLAKVHYDKAKNNADTKKNEILANVKIQFYKNIALKEKISVYERHISKSKKNSAETEYSQNQLDILKHKYEIDMLDFLALLGLGLDSLVDLSGQIKLRELNLNLQQCILWAYQFRPEMKNTQYQETIDSISLNLITMEKYPTIVVGASYDWTGDDKKQNEKDWYLSLNINYPIFDGGAVFSKIKQKKIMSRQATIERSKIEEEIKLEVRKAYNEYNFWYDKAVKLNDIKNGSFEKEILKIDTLYGYIKSLLELELAVGKQLL